MAEPDNLTQSLRERDMAREHAAMWRECAEELAEALDTLAVESGGVCIPNNNLTIAREQALSALAAYAARLLA